MTFGRSVGNAAVMERVWRDAMLDFLAVYGFGEFYKRATEIVALPRVTWKGKELRTIRCTGTFGQGPHDVNVPEYVLWHLISLKGFLCPYHR